MKKLITTAVTVFLVWASVAYAGSTGSEKLKKLAIKPNTT